MSEPQSSIRQWRGHPHRFGWKTISGWLKMDPDEVRWLYDPAFTPKVENMALERRALKREMDRLRKQHYAAMAEGEERLRVLDMILEGEKP